MCKSPANLTKHVHHDWPNQCVYFYNVIAALTATPAACLGTDTVRDTAAWLATSQANMSLGGSLLETWTGFQFTYYLMPRHPGDRIEAPWTLGMKCWAFAYLDQHWNASARQALSTRLAADGGSPLNVFLTNYAAATVQSTTLCEEVMANCFVNASYNPARNGTCPTKVLEFRAGFFWQNTLHGDPIHYPFYG